MDFSRIELGVKFCYGGIYDVLALLVNPNFLIRRNLYRHIKRYAEKIEGKVLDFGCGSKPYKHLFSRCNSYSGCDIEKSGHCHENENIDFYYDGKKLPFSDEEFDWVFSTEVFEHIFNLEEILKELNRVLVPGGRIFCTVPFVWYEHEIPYDYARYTSFGIKSILERNGFCIVNSHKSTLYAETIFQMMIPYIRGTFEKISKNLIFNVIIQILFVFPINIVGLVFGKTLPKDERIYSNNIIVCQKIKDCI